MDEQSQRNFQHRFWIFLLPQKKMKTLSQMESIASWCKPTLFTTSQRETGHLLHCWKSESANRSFDAQGVCTNRLNKKVEVLCTGVLTGKKTQFVKSDFISSAVCWHNLSMFIFWTIIFTPLPIFYFVHWTYLSNWSRLRRTPCSSSLWQIQTSHRFWYQCFSLTWTACWIWSNEWSLQRGTSRSKFALYQ